MADEISKPFLNKAGDFLSNVGTAIGDRWDQAAQDQEKLGLLSDEDRALAVSSPYDFQEQQKATGAMNSVLNAQNPTPLGNANQSTVLGQIGGKEDVEEMVLNSKAVAQGRPLSGDEITAALNPKGVGAVKPALEDLGNGRSIIDPNPQAPLVTTEAIASGGPGFSNPYNSAFGAHALGINQAAQAGQLKAVAENEFYKKSEALAQESANKTEALSNAFNFKYQEQMDDLTASMKEYKELAGQKVIPAAFLARQDTGAALATGISVALGAMAGALNGTNQNIGLEMINKAIDRDVASQQFNLEQATRIKGNDISNQNSLLSKMKEKFADDKSAIIATKSVMTSMAMDKMNAQLTSKGGSRDVAIKSQANLAMSQMLEKKIGYELQLKTAQEAAFAKQESMKGVDYYNMSNEQALAHFGKDADKYVRDYGMATDPQLAKDFIQKVKPAEATIQKVKDLYKFSKEFNMANRADYTRMKTMLTDLQLELKGEQAYALGVLTGPDMELLREITGDPTSINPLVNSASKLEQLIVGSQKKFDAKVRNYGFEPVNSRPGSVKSALKPIK